MNSFLFSKAMISMTMILFIIPMKSFNLFKFIPKRDSNNQSLCSKATPLAMVEIFNIIPQYPECVPAATTCSWLCMTNQNCSSFNALDTSSCQLFRNSSNHNFDLIKGCKFYEVIFA